MACVEKPLFNAYAGIFIGAIYLNLVLRLHLQSYSVYVSSDDSGETVKMSRLVCTFDARACYKYPLRIKFVRFWYISHMRAVFCAYCLRQFHEHHSNWFLSQKRIKLVYELRFYLKICTKTVSGHHAVASLGLVLARKSDTICGKVPFKWLCWHISEGLYV